MARSPEHHNGNESKRRSPEYAIETPRRLEVDRPAPHDNEAEWSKARSEALKEASSKEQYKARERPEEQATEPVTSSKRKLNEGFKKTMARVRSEMSPAQRIFSKVIHLPAVEKASDAVGSTVARPNAILSGSLGAFIVTSGLYLVARYYGFSLSGSETILAFAIGWVIGLVFDLGRGMFKGRS